jgi:transcriptional regulator with XRE-family HTH domain
MSTAEPKTVDIIVGQNVRTIRKAKKLTQQQLGDATGITFQQVQKYERGTNRISASTAVAFAQRLRVGLYDIFAGVDLAESDPVQGKIIAERQEVMSHPKAMALADALVELAPQKRLMVLNAALSLAETAIGLNGDAD